MMTSSSKSSKGYNWYIIIDWSSIHKSRSYLSLYYSIVYYLSLIFLSLHYFSPIPPLFLFSRKLQPKKGICPISIISQIEKSKKVNGTGLNWIKYSGIGMTKDLHSRRQISPPRRRQISIAAARSRLHAALTAQRNLDVPPLRPIAPSAATIIPPPLETTVQIWQADRQPLRRDRVDVRWAREWYGRG
ncbi:hypothetical protein CASFOL_019808 [Castilleja foliolosa]|uniref:Uncharacterized protein n=1 Tax=Castilleja foliolosa TaxID=1961234 RepID=A0ABD3D2L3_9LAMI